MFSSEILQINVKSKKRYLLQEGVNHAYDLLGDSSSRLTWYLKTQGHKLKRQGGPTVKAKITALALISLTAASVSLLTANSAESAGARTTLTTTVSFGFGPSEDYRYVWDSYPEGCEDEGCVESITDPYGYPLKVGIVTMTNTISGLAPGWSICEDQDAYISMEKYAEAGFVKLPTTDWTKYKASLVGGEGYRGENFESDTAVLVFEAGNSQRPKYQGWVLICGPDNRTPSDIGWKLITGKTITLPRLNSW